LDEKKELFKKLCQISEQFQKISVINVKQRKIIDDLLSTVGMYDTDACIHLENQLKEIYKEA
jgi:hypothetical protein